VGTPVRAQFRSALAEKKSLDLPIPEQVPLIAVVGGSQGAVAVNRLIRQCAPAWFEAGIWVVHLTGENDPDAATLSHPQYVALPFYADMAGVLQRANLAISRAGAGTLTELAVTHTPAILIPYPYAAEDHQTYNAQAFAETGAALLFQQNELTTEFLQNRVLQLVQCPEALGQMADAMGKLAIVDSAEQLAGLIKTLMV
jgi:UDP-N-acetylglucosamine--N-acetylmuramyl-(pentapeptide) pyrophosphoryl-undecaprenol N-acetylglucosamine transferase